MNGSECLGCGTNCQTPCIQYIGIKEELKKGKEMKNEKGFTLVELLIVLAIVGILLGIAIPFAPQLFVSLFGFVVILGFFHILAGIYSVIIQLKHSANTKKVLKASDFRDMAWEMACGFFSLFAYLKWKRNCDIRNGVKKPFEIKNPFYKG